MSCPYGLRIGACLLGRKGEVSAGLLFAHERPIVAEDQSRACVPEFEAHPGGIVAGGQAVGREAVPHRVRLPFHPSGLAHSIEKPPGVDRANGSGLSAMRSEPRGGVPGKRDHAAGGGLGYVGLDPDLLLVDVIPLQPVKLGGAKAAEETKGEIRDHCGRNARCCFEKSAGFVNREKLRLARTDARALYVRDDSFLAKAFLGAPIQKGPDAPQRRKLGERRNMETVEPARENCG